MALCIGLRQRGFPSMSGMPIAGAFLERRAPPRRCRGHHELAPPDAHRVTEACARPARRGVTSRRRNDTGSRASSSDSRTSLPVSMRPQVDALTNSESASPSNRPLPDRDLVRDQRRRYPHPGCAAAPPRHIGTTPSCGAGRYCCRRTRCRSCLRAGCEPRRRVRSRRDGLPPVGIGQPRGRGAARGRRFSRPQGNAD